MDPLLPADFFLYQVEIKKAHDFKKLTQLPDLSELLAEESLAEVSLGWNEGGILGLVEVKQPLQASFFPGYAKGDALEIFIDTRDLKKGGFASQFCHQFVLLGQEVEGIVVQEVTRFRGEDSHPLCDPGLVEVKSVLSKKGYSLSFYLPKEVLHGYDPEQCPRLGFAYRIFRHKGKPSHFPFSFKNFEPLMHTAQWASLILT